MNNQEHQIIPVKLGITNCYLIRGAGDYILVDAGPPNSIQKFIRKLKQLLIDPSRIKLIFITHEHFDHTGSLAEIRNLTGGIAAMHHHDKELVERGTVLLPRGFGLWGNILNVFVWVMKHRIKKLIRPVKVDRGLEDKPFSLESFQINGKILPTPGHTKGSMSLILKSGEAFVGDTAMSGFPRLKGPGPFVLGEDLKAMRRSWQLLLDEGAKWIYPSHGESFDAGVLRRYLRA
jgi:glyoxylase-like metal-dependent hydrolase (beta-lactamase superfamily II)